MANICSSPWPEKCPLRWDLLPCHGCMDEDCVYNPNNKLIGPTMNFTYLRRIETHFSRRIFLHASSLKDLVFDGDIKGTSPLILACKQEDLDVVKHIVESWKVDVRAAATFHLLPFSHIMSVKATPVFVAALYGHCNIVRYLVEKGADVNVKVYDPHNLSSYDKQTPLEAAFMNLYSEHNPEKRQYLSSTICYLLQHGAKLPYRLHLLYREPLWMERSCDADILRELIKHGMNVNIGHHGSSVLHHWASLTESTPYNPQPLAVVRLLVRKGANLMARDKKGYTPIRVAAEADPVNLRVFDFLSEREEIDRVEKIVALELAGAVILTSSRNASPDARTKAFEYWRRALQLRKLDTKDQVRKTTIKRTSGNKGEWDTSDELEAVIQNPSEHNKQAFLVRLRIASADRDDTGALLPSFTSFIYGYLFKIQSQTNSRFEELLDSTFAILEMFCQKTTASSDSCYVLADASRKLLYALSTIQTASPQLLTIGIIKNSINLLVGTDRLYPLLNADRYMKVMLDLAKLMAGLPHMLEDDHILASLTHLLNKDMRDGMRRTVLHLALVGADKKTKNLAAIIELLLRCKADVNAVDEDRAAPLHYLAYYGNQDQFSTIGGLLCDYGADIDQVNLSRKTAMDIWAEKCSRKRLLNADRARAAEWNELPKWSHRFPKLLCLCAKRIRSRVHSSQISSLEIPDTLRPFLEKH